MSEGTNSRIGATRRAIRVVSHKPTAVNASLGNTPNIGTEIQPGEKWVRFGRQNLFPEFVVGLAHNYQPVLSAIDKMALYLAGEGIEFVDAAGKPVEQDAAIWAELMQYEGEGSFLRSTFKDLVMIGARSFEVAYDGQGKRMPAAVYHLDATRLRLGEKNAQGIIETMYWSSNWELWRGNKEKYKAQELPNWQTAVEGRERLDKYVSYARLKIPGQDYYGWPWWIGALTDMEVGARIPHFNRTQLDTGFRPAFHIHVFTDKDDADLSELDSDVEAIFTGVDGKTYVVTHGTVGEGAPQLTKLERGDHAGELDKIGDRSELIAYKAIGIPPILMGAEVKTGMGGQELAIQQSITMFQRTVCMPQQHMVTLDAWKLVKMRGGTSVKARIKQLRPIDDATDAVLQRQAYIASTTVGEHRIATGKPLFNTDVDNKLLCDALKGAGNLDPVSPNA